MNGVPWTAERDAELRRLFDLDMPYSQIAAEMGMSKNAVLGRAGRLNLRRIITVPRSRPQDFMAAGTCLYGLNDTLPIEWCGKPVAQVGTAWCEEHRAVVYWKRPGSLEGLADD